MIVRRNWHGFEVDFPVERNRAEREMSRQAFLLGNANMRSFYSEPAIEHYVCPKHDRGADSQPCATIQIMRGPR